MAGAITIEDLAGDTGNLTTYTFSARALGAAVSDRYILVGAAWREGASADRSISSASIGGVSATIWTPNSHSTANGVCIFGAAVPTGTTGDIVITFNAANSRCCIAVARCTGIDSSALVDSTQVASTAGNAATFTVTGDVDTLTDGVAFAYMFKSSGNAAWTLTYDGTGGLTESTQQSVENADLQAMAGFAAITSGATPRQITATYTQGGAGTTNGHSLAVVSFGPAAAGSVGAGLTNSILLQKRGLIS
jgi:hypothetical protein